MASKSPKACLEKEKYKNTGLSLPVSVSYIHRNLPQKGGKIKKIFIMYEVQPSAVGSESQLKRSRGGRAAFPAASTVSEKRLRGCL